MKILLLAGTAEARELSFALPANRLICSLAGMTKRPARLGGETRVGGFGGIEGLVGFIREQNIGIVVDATHPFAARMSANAVNACERTGAALLQVVRAPWDAKPNWEQVADLSEAASVLAPGSKVFLATGRASLPAFASRDDVEFVARVIDDLPGDFPLAKGRFVVSHPPFTIEEEVETLKRLEVDTLISRNSGGTGGIEKLVAADRLELSVIMIKRPVYIGNLQVGSVGEALIYLRENNWLDA